MNALIIGGTGIIGRAVEKVLKEKYSKVIIISNDQRCNYGNVTYIYTDINDLPHYNKVIDDLNTKFKKWDVVVDLMEFSSLNAETTYLNFSANSEHIIILSTALVYDPLTKIKGVAVNEDHPTAKTGVWGGYVDKKLDVEKYWNDCDYLSWTLLRPYHILGSGSHLGCLPFHNRDPNILKDIRDGKPINLVNGGTNQISYISAHDIAQQILLITNNSAAFNAHLNICYEFPVTSLEYYEEIGNQIGQPIYINNISSKEFLGSGYGWELTAMEHLYNSDRLFSITNKRPILDIRTCIRDSINYLNNIGTIYEGANIVHERMNLPPKPDFEHLRNILT